MSLISTFYTAIFADLEYFSTSISAAAPVRNFFALDLAYLLSRVESEGDSFVCSRLPLLGKAAEQSAITCEKLVVPDGFNLFGKSRLPVFLHTLFAEGWQEDGTPLFTLDYSPSKRSYLALVLQAIRQVTLAFSKVEDKESLQTEDEAIKLFEERMAEDFDLRASSWVIRRARKYISDVLYEDGRLAAPLAQWLVEPFGRHGPGAVAGGEKGARKWYFGSVPGFPSMIFRYHTEDNLRPELMPKVDRISHLHVVPKDFKSKRTICIEPKELQFAQQGLKAILYDLIEKHPLTRRSISFTDQSRNQVLCKDLRLATVDLKDASDRLRLSLARILLPKEVFALLTLARSGFISLPSGRTIKNTSLATMGSALCFPLETLLFWALARSVADQSKQKQKTVRVFGDDIILPRDVADIFIKQVEGCGCIVNRTKSCYGRTLVRESCGAWMVGGHECNVVKFHYRNCSNAKQWISTVDSAKQFLSLSGGGLYDHTVKSILETSDQWYVRFVRKYIGADRASFKLAPVQGLKNFSFFKLCYRWNTSFQRTEVLVPFLSWGAVASTLPGYDGLYAHAVGNDTRPRPFGTERVKVGWVHAAAFFGRVV